MEGGSEESFSKVLKNLDVHVLTGAYQSIFLKKFCDLVQLSGETDTLGVFVLASSVWKTVRET